MKIHPCVYPYERIVRGFISVGVIHIHLPTISANINSFYMHDYSGFNQPMTESVCVCVRSSLRVTLAAWKREENTLERDKQSDDLYIPGTVISSFLAPPLRPIG